MTSSTEGTVDKQDQKDGNELSCLPADPKYDLFDGEDPFAVIAAQRREAEAAEATEDEVDEQSASEDELTKALMASFEDGNHEDRLPESAASNSEESSTAPRLILSPIAQGTSGSSPSTSYKVPRINADDVNDESDEFEDVPLNVPISAAATLTPIDERTHTPQSSTLTKKIIADSTTPSPRNKEQGLSNRMPTGLNYHGLPKRYDETGAEIGYIEAPPAGHTYAYASDEPLESYDPYHTPGCRRRMVFESDPIPEQQRYKVQDAQFEKKTNKVDFPNAVDKAYDWCQVRRGMIGATKETIEDGKLARHFILKMGPPHGLHGEATRLADRLKALVSHYFHNRLAKSHLTLETEIPYHHLAGQGYFRSYMDAIRHLMNPPSKSAKKLGERLTITLAEEPTRKFRTCDPASFHPQPFDYEAEWTLRVGTAQHVFTETFPSTQKHMPDGWRPTPEQIEAARNAYLTRGRVANENKPAQVNAAIADIKVFLDEVERYNKPESSTDTFVQGSGAQPSLGPFLQGAPVVSGRQEALEVLRSLQSYRAATASPVQAAFQIYADAAPASTMQHRSQ